MEAQDTFIEPVGMAKQFYSELYKRETERGCDRGLVEKRTLHSELSEWFFIHRAM